MRISDWSSDVCSSDLELPNGVFQVQVIEHHRIQVTHQRAKSVLQIEAMLLKVRRGIANGVGLVRLDAQQTGPRAEDRKSVVKGKSVSVRVDLGGRRIIKKKKRTQ